MTVDDAEQVAAWRYGFHGGMGMTEELSIGHYFKRLTAVRYEFGSTDEHVTQYAELTRW